MLYLEQEDGGIMINAEDIKTVIVSRKENKITVTRINRLNDGAQWDSIEVKYTEANLEALRTANEPRNTNFLSGTSMQWNWPNPAFPLYDDSPNKYID